MRRPRVKLDNLVVFMAVADKPGIDGAAVELALSPSGVRKQLDTKPVISPQDFDGERAE